MIQRFLSLLLFTCTLFPASSQDLGANSMVIVQDGKEIRPDDMGLYSLKRDAFVIRWNDMRYDTGDGIHHACAVAFPQSDSIFLEVSPGMATMNTGCFAPGMGMAGYNDRPHEEIFIKDEACHYIWYQDSTDRRANLIEERKGVLTLEWPVTHFRPTDTEDSLPMHEYSSDVLNMAAFSDNNANGFIDEGELKKFILSFGK